MSGQAAVHLPIAKLASMHAGLSSAPDRGKALEDFCAEFFNSIPGVDVVERRVLDDAHSQEVDLVLDNYQHPDGLRDLDQILFVEAKNWDRRVGSAEVAWFDWKIRLSGRKEGFLVVASGVTGRAEDESSAWKILSQANMEGRHLIVLTPDEMVTCRNSAHVGALVRWKLRRLANHKSPLQHGQTPWLDSTSSAS